MTGPTPLWVIMVHDDGSIRTLPVHPQFEEVEFEEDPPKTKKKRAKPRRRCQTCDTLVDRDVWEDHKLGHFRVEPDTGASTAEIVGHVIEEPEGEMPF